MKLLKLTCIAILVCTSNDFSTEVSGGIPPCPEFPPGNGCSYHRAWRQVTPKINTDLHKILEYYTKSIFLW